MASAESSLHEEIDIVQSGWDHSFNTKSAGLYHFSESNSSLQQLIRAFGLRKGEKQEMAEIVGKKLKVIEMSISAKEALT